VGFEATIPVFEQAKTVHALERVATVIGKLLLYIRKKKSDDCRRLMPKHVNF
jgi:hypothetical protein